MYGAIWRILPGPAVLRALILLAFAVGVVYACFEWVFPWVNDTFMILNDPSFDAAPAITLSAG
ncbi:MAG: hypothetical protein FWD83_02905 [Promicromonosporaceae bacterium]|nr:hypothetical protein [Promicromonosporaceae bacterium]